MMSYTNTVYQRRGLSGVFLAAVFCLLAPALARCEDPAESAGGFKPVGWVQLGFGTPGSGPVTVRDNYGYVCSGGGDFAILDLRDKARPRVAGFVPSGRFTSYLRFYGNLAYFHNSARFGGGTFAIDFTKPYARDEINDLEFFGPPKRVRYVERSDGYIKCLDRQRQICVSISEEAVNVFSLENPVEPRRISSTPLPPETKFESSLLASSNVLLFCLMRQPAPSKPAKAPTRACADLIGALEDLFIKSFFSAFIYPLDREQSHYKIGNEIYRFDFSDPAHPELREFLSIAKEEKLESADDDNLIVGNAKTKQFRLFRLDAHGTNVPVEKAALSIPDNSGPHVFCAPYSNLVYLIDGKGGTEQYNLSYASGHSRWFVYEIGKGASAPVYAWEAPYPSAFCTLNIQDGYGYINDYNFGVRVFDLKNPAQPREIGGTPTVGEGNGVYVDAQRKLAFVWVMIGGVIHAVDVSVPAKPKKLGYYWDGAWVNYSDRSRVDFIAGKNNVIYCAKKKLEIIDAADPAAMKHTGFLTDADGKDLAGRIHVEKDFLYVVTASNFLVFNAQNAARPALAGAVDLPKEFKSVYSFYIKNAMAYIMGASNLLAIIDAREPARPRVMATLDLSPHFSEEMEFLGHIAVSDAGYGYITAGEGRKNTRLLVVNFKDHAKPEALKWVDSKSWGGSGWDKWAGINYNMTIDEERKILFVCKCVQIEAFDIGDPENPVFLACQNINTGASDWQWTIGPYHAPYLYVPTLRALYILKLEKPERSQGAAGPSE